MGYGKTNIAGGGLRVKSFQTGVWTYEWWKTEIPITAVDVKSSIIVLNVENQEFRTVDYWLNASFVDSTHIKIESYQSDIDPPPTMRWYVYELAGFKSLQFVSATIDKANSNDRVTRKLVPILGVNPAKTFIFTTIGVNDYDDKYARPGGCFYLESSGQYMYLCNYDANSITVKGNAFVLELR